jgi:diguanylate cyclase (GGDEF)-like protein
MVDEAKLSQVLCDLARTMITESPMQGIADRLVKCIVEVLPVTSAGVTLIIPETGSRYLAASDASALRYTQLQSDIQDGPLHMAHATGETVSVADLRDDVRFCRFAAAALPAGLAAVFTFPLRHDTDRLGVMDLYRDTAGPLDAHDIAIAQTLADVTAAYLVMARARDDARAVAESFRQIALHDMLTGLPNRQLLEDRIENAAQRARRSETSAAILFVDLDQFKQVNDVHGHEVGDELLVAIAGRLSTLVRPSDTLARLSGDEFVFLCEDLDCPEDVEQITSRIADALATPFESAGCEIMITASVGVAYAGPGKQISKHLVAEADKAMYEAKRSRNGVQSH